MSPRVARLFGRRASPAVVVLFACHGLAACWPGLARAQQDPLYIEPSGAVTVGTNLTVRGAVSVGQIVGKGAVPRGAILMWSGDPARLGAEAPGWALCDGTNGTPDLKSRFIVGYDPASADYKAVKNAGGAASVTLGVDQMPRHNHRITIATAGSHTHTITATDHGWAFPTVQQGDSRKSKTSARTDAAGDHTHNASSDDAGAGKPVDIRPPYYVLAFIMYTGQ